MIIYHSATTYQILGQKVHLYSEQLGEVLNTVAEIGDKIHYLGNEFANLTTAVFAWEDLNGRPLTKEELRQVLNDNNIT